MRGGAVWGVWGFGFGFGFASASNLFWLGGGGGVGPALFFRGLRFGLFRFYFDPWVG